jgi:hypothetical protein
MWRLPDGTDLRLCRLAMAGLALVWQGQLLHSVDDLQEEPNADGQQTAPLQLAVQPAVLQAWLEWQQGRPAASGCSHESKPLTKPPSEATQDDAAAPAAMRDQAALVTTVAFDSVQGAVAALQHFLHCCVEGECSSERVCCRHLGSAPAVQCMQPSCTWLQTCKVLSAHASLPDSLVLDVKKLQSALNPHKQTMEQRQASLAVLLPRWLSLGVLYIDETTACDVA